jgi:hypothetical protein
MKVLENKIVKKNQGTAKQNIIAIQNILNEQKGRSADRLSSKKVLLCALMVWKNRVIAELMAAETSRIIKTVYKKRSIFFGGKSEKGLLAGIFYLLGRKHNAKKTQQEIARNLSTNDVTVRDSYREWLKAFPDFFGTSISTES